MHAIREPWVVDLESSRGRISGDENEVLVATQLDLGDDRSTGVELALDQPEIGSPPLGKPDATTGIAADGSPDQSIVEGVATIAGQPGIEGTGSGVDPVVPKHHRHRRNGATRGGKRIGRSAPQGSASP